MAFPSTTLSKSLMIAFPSTTLSKSLMIALIIFNFLFLSYAFYAEPPFYDGAQPPFYGGAQSPHVASPSHAHVEHPKLCNFDDYYKYGYEIFNDIETCNVGVLQTCQIQEIYQLGDSVSDVGNLIHEDASSPYASAPYGVNFPGGATGRASNGKLMIDYFAMDAGLPLLPPFKKSDADFSHGINFAVGGSTALPWDVLAAMNISSTKTNSSLSVQLDWMSAYFHSFCNNERDCSAKLQNALFMLGPFGGSDYYYALFQGKTMKEIRSELMPKVVNAIMAAVRRVIGFGAKRVVVPGLYSIYRVPLFQMIFSGYPDMYDFNEDLAFYHNAELRQAINKLNEEERPNTVVVYGDYSGAYRSLINYERLDVTTCCGSGGGLYNFELSRMCGESGASVCPEPDLRMSWDGLHLTQEAYRIMTKYMLYHFFLDLHCPY